MADEVMVRAPGGFINSSKMVFPDGTLMQVGPTGVATIPRNLLGQALAAGFAPVAGDDSHSAPTDDV